MEIIKLINQDIISQYEFLFCILAGFFAGVFKILDHSVEISLKSVLNKLVMCMILGSLGFFIFDLKFISSRMRVGLSFLLAYGGSERLNKLIDNIIYLIGKIAKI